MATFLTARIVLRTIASRSMRASLLNGAGDWMLGYLRRLLRLWCLLRSPMPPAVTTLS